LQGGDYTPGQFGYGGDAPQYQSGGRFNFDLEGDKGYQFARDEAIKATNRASAGQGSFNSGNRLAEIADRVTGVASQYANDAYNRQMGTSRENYGRGVTEYGLESARESDQYGRALTGYGLESDRQQNMYGQNQNYLNRLSSLVGVGQTAVGQSGAAGSNMANAVGNINAQNAQNQIGASNLGYSSMNNAVQGGMSNYMLNNYLNKSPLPTYAQPGYTSPSPSQW